MGIMKPAKGVFKRHGSSLWQHRIYVPNDLRPLYGGKDVLPAKSLGTSELAEANRRARQSVAEMELAFAAEREKVKTVAPSEAASSVVHPEMIERWAIDHRNKVADADLEARTAFHVKASADPAAFWAGKPHDPPSAMAPRRHGNELLGMAQH